MGSSLDNTAHDSPSASSIAASQLIAVTGPRNTNRKPETAIDTGNLSHIDASD